MGGTPTPPNQPKKESTKGAAQSAKMLEERRKRDEEIRKRLKEENLNQRRVLAQGTYTPIVELNQYCERVFRCPVCKHVSGNAAPRNPQNLYYSKFHSPDCVNIDRVPIER